MKYIAWSILKGKIKYFICSLMIISLIVTCAACYPTRENKAKDSDSDTVLKKGDQAKAQEDKPLLVFATSAMPILTDYKMTYPEVNLEVVVIDGVGEEAWEKLIQKHGFPDLILDTNQRSVRFWAQQERIYDFSQEFDQDSSFDESLYYPNVTMVGRTGDGLYGIPLGLQVKYLTFLDETWEISRFGNMQEQYSVEEFLDTLEDELDLWSQNEKENYRLVLGNMGLFQYTEELLWSCGAIRIEGDSVELDRDLYMQICRIREKEYMNMNQYLSLVSGQLPNIVQPESGAGNYLALTWNDCIAPQAGLIFGQSVHQAIFRQDIHVVWIPMKNESESQEFAAEVAVWGMIGAKSERVEEAYTVLRQLMDINQNVYAMPNGFGFENHIPFSINRQCAIQMIQDVEQSTTLTIRLDPAGSQTIPKVPLNEELKEELLWLLENITHVYATDPEVSEAIHDALGWDLDGLYNHDQFYEEIVEAMQTYAE